MNIAKEKKLRNVKIDGDEVAEASDQYKNMKDRVIEFNLFNSV